LSAEAARDDLDADGAAAPGEVPGRVLVVDDTELNRDLLVRRLAKRGFEVATATNGREAVELVARQPFDVMLLDIMMPEMDGYQVLEHLRAGGVQPDVRVIMISAVDELDSVVRCLELGADDYLTKPFNSALLGARLDSSLARKRLRDRQQAHARSLERELEIGREIQRQFLPESLPAPPGWEIAASLAPARQVSGDFFDAFPLGAGERVVLAVADVCDKGVGAALFMALYRTLLRAGFDGAGADPAAGVAAVLRRANDYIAATHSRSNMFATVFLAVLDTAAGELTWANGGHEPPMLLRAGGGVERLAPTGPAVGMLESVEFRVERTALAPGDRLVAFTDGVTEARSAAAAELGEDRLAAVVAADGSAEETLRRVEDELERHGAGAERFDDVTLLVVRRVPQ